MDTIKEQFEKLGLAAKHNKRLNKSPNYSEDNLCHQVLVTLLDMIICRKQFSEVVSYLSSKKLYFAPHIMNKLKKLHEESIRKNQLNEVAFKKYILSLNFDLALSLFESMQAKHQPTKNKARKKKVISYEMKPFENSKPLKHIPDCSLTFPSFKKNQRPTSKKIDHDIRAVEDINILISKVSLNTTYQDFLILLGFSGEKFSKKINKRLKQFHYSIRKSKHVNQLELLNFINKINSINGRTGTVGSTEEKILEEFLREDSQTSKKKSIEDKLEVKTNSVQIGLGLESDIKIGRVRAADVIIDKNTKASKHHDKHIIYSAGWSLKK